jgi:hypothetical protein
MTAHPGILARPAEQRRQEAERDQQLHPDAVDVFAVIVAVGNEHPIPEADVIRYVELGRELQELTVREALDALAAARYIVRNPAGQTCRVALDQAAEAAA